MQTRDNSAFLSDISVFQKVAEFYSGPFILAFFRMRPSNGKSLDTPALHDVNVIHLGCLDVNVDVEKPPERDST